MGRGAIVTGASGSLGGAIATRMVQLGWDCFLSGHSFPTESDNSYCIDLHNDGAAKELIAKARARLNSIEALIVAHGIHRPNRPDISVRDQIHEMLLINYVTVSELVSELNSEPEAHAVILTSIAGSRGSRRGDSYYAASKAAVHALVLSSRDTCSPKYLTAVASGPVNNPMAKDRGYDDNELLTPIDVR